MKDLKTKLFKILNTSKAFTLFEMAIAITISTILISIAMPSYRKTVARFEANEGKHVLVVILGAQKRFKLENGDYADDFADLDIEIPLNLKYFVDPGGYSDGGGGGSTLGGSGGSTGIGARLGTGAAVTYAWIADIAVETFGGGVAYAGITLPNTSHSYSMGDQLPATPGETVGHIYRIDDSYTLWIQDTGEIHCTPDNSSNCTEAGF